MPDEPGENDQAAGGAGMRIVPGETPEAGRGPSDEFEVRDAIHAEVRAMIASIPLPADGPIPADDKIKVREQTVAVMKKYGVSHAELARQLGNRCHASIISQVLREKYGHSDHEWIRRMNAWCESFTRRAEAIRTEGIATTGVVLAVRALADYAKTQGVITAGYGPAGIGKSESAKVCVQEDPSAAYVRLRSTHTSPTAFLRLVAAAIHLGTEGGASRLCDAIVEKLRGSHRLIVIDEWHLADRRIHEAVRDIHDEAGVPFLLLGTVEIYSKLQTTRSRRGEAQYDQFFSRVGWCLDLTRLVTDGGGARPLFTESEVRDVFRADKVRLTRDGLKFLQALACSVGLGCLRIARRVFEMAAKVARRRDVPIDRGMLHRALVEQAVPNGVDADLVSRIVEETETGLVALAG